MPRRHFAPARTSEHVRPMSGKLGAVGACDGRQLIDAVADAEASEPRIVPVPIDPGRKQTHSRAVFGEEEADWPRHSAFGAIVSPAADAARLILAKLMAIWARLTWPAAARSPFSTASAMSATSRWKMTNSLWSSAS